jgi:hypothetical protein
MGVGYRQAFHAGSARSFDPFLGVLNHDTVSRNDQITISPPGVDPLQSFEKNFRFGFSVLHVFSANNDGKMVQQIYRGKYRFNFISKRA